MALRETVRSIRSAADKDAAFETRKPQIISDWQRTVLQLNTDIKSWLKDLEEDGSLKFHPFDTEITEELLGSYRIEAMKIEIGKFVVQIQPTGRMIFGSHGRVDMFRQGRSANDERVYMLNFKDDAASSWKLRKPAGERTGARDLQELDQATFEAALESLLK